MSVGPARFSEHMNLTTTLTSIVKLPLSIAGRLVGAVARRTSSDAPAAPPTDAGPAPDSAAPAAPTQEAPAKKAPARKAPAKAAAPAEKAAPAKKAPAATKAPVATKADPAPAAETAPAAKKAATPQKPLARGAVVEPAPEPVTEIDAAAEDEDVDVTPADLAKVMGRQLDESSSDTDTDKS